jgi:hypothetical protein
MHMDEGTKNMNTSNRHDAYEAACKTDVDKTHTETNTGNIGIMRAGLHTREDNVAREWPPADNKVLAKYEYEEQPNVQNVPNVLSQEELSADDVTVDKHVYVKEPEVQYNTTTPDNQKELPADNENLKESKYSHNKIVMTNLTETVNVEKMLAYMNENYENTSQMRDEDKPTADLRNLYNIDEDKPTAALENLYSIDETARRRQGEAGQVQALPQHERDDKPEEDPGHCQDAHRHR